MIRWIQQKKWLPEVLLASSFIFIFGGLDLLQQGPLSIFGTLAIGVGLLFVRNFSFLVAIFLILSVVFQVGFSLLPIFGSLGIPFLALIIGAFSPKPWSQINFAVAMFSGLVVAANTSYNPALSLSNVGVGQLNDLARLSILAVLIVLSFSLTSLAWISGQLLITRFVHVGTELDRLFYEEAQLQLSIELAEQSKRFEIARDINEAVVQHMSSVLANAEGGLYAAKADPAAGIRAIERILVSARLAHTELRRLFDMINRGRIASISLPTLDDLEKLAISMRESGLDVSITHFGERFKIEQGAELAIYRIIFDALRNVKQHNPAGAIAAVEISWLENGLQVMIKDNGTEVLRRAELGPDGLLAPYDASDDLDTLLEKVVGPGLTAMRERAEGFGGSLEAQRVVGIGFTVSAFFPLSAVRSASSQVIN